MKGVIRSKQQIKKLSRKRSEMREIKKRLRSTRERNNTENPNLFEINQFCWIGPQKKTMYVCRERERPLTSLNVS